MATVASVRQEGEGRTYRHTWAPLLNGDDGAAVSLPGAADRSIQVTGTFGVGAVLGIEGSNLENPAVDTDWFPLTDLQGTAISFTTAGGVAGEQITEMVTHIRPHVTAGDGSTSLTVTMLSRSTRG